MMNIPVRPVEQAGYVSNRAVAEKTNGLYVLLSIKGPAEIVYVSFSSAALV